MLTLSRKLDECKPLATGGTVDEPASTAGHADGTGDWYLRAEYGGTASGRGGSGSGGAGAGAYTGSHRAQPEQLQVTVMN